MEIAKYSAAEFFYADFKDYVTFSGIPYKSSDNSYFSSLAKDIAKFDKGDGILIPSSQILKFLPRLSVYEEFKNCKVHLIESPVFHVRLLNRLNYNVEKELVNVASYDVVFNNDFEGERFFFSGIFYLYSIQFYSDNEKYCMRIRGYEEPSETPAEEYPVL